MDQSRLSSLSHLVFVHEVVTGEVLLGLQRHQLVVVTDTDTGLGSALLLVTVRELSCNTDNGYLGLIRTEVLRETSTMLFSNFLL